MKLYSSSEFSLLDQGFTLLEWYFTFLECGFTLGARFHSFQLMFHF